MARSESVRVNIFSQSYSLVASGEDAAELEQLAAKVDDLMRSIASRTGSMDSTRAAVLACLHLADQLRNAERELSTLRSEVANKAREFTLLLDEAIGEDVAAAGQKAGD
ncbi:MAG TPA: cell division protein ZapA [Bryobacteraceae bacterium]|nr:cell division protein ZapA [Bryobacteraceae bacterium]